MKQYNNTTIYQYKTATIPQYHNTKVQQYNNTKVKQFNNATKQRNLKIIMLKLHLNLIFCFCNLIVSGFFKRHDLYTISFYITIKLCDRLLKIL